MKTKINNYTGVLTVTLSRRNLETLLAKLDVEESKRAIARVNENGTWTFVVAEDNNVHYADRAPGEMHPREEAKLTNWRTVFRDGKTAA